MNTQIVTADTLSDRTEVDCPVVVHPDGTVTDAPHNVYAPALYDDALEYGAAGQEWELLDGYSGQHGYSGPVMHNSEYIGGRMADDILSTPGTYVVIVAQWSGEQDDDESTIEGWAVARLIG